MGDQPNNIHHNHRLQLTYEPIETIQPNPRDPRIYAAAEKRRIAKSLTMFGAMPMIVTSERVVLSGNIWLEASKLAGITQLPIVVADHLTPAQAEAFMVAQVRLVERGEWDQKMLGEILRDLTLQDLDFDLEITGFDVPEIDLCIENLDQPKMAFPCKYCLMALVSTPGTGMCANRRKTIITTNVKSILFLNSGSLKSLFIWYLF